MSGKGKKGQPFNLESTCTVLQRDLCDIKIVLYSVESVIYFVYDVPEVTKCSTLSTAA